MSTCLTDTELQASADRELPPDRRAHLEACAACRARQAARQASLDAFAEWIDRTEVPAGLKDRVTSAVTRDDRAGGATTLRSVPRARSWRSQLTLAAGAAAVVAFIVFGLLPRVGEPTKLSAAEILGRSLQALGEVSGVERLEYDLRFEGLHSPLLGGQSQDSAVIRQIIDHDHGRFLITRRAADGALVAAIAEDPAAGVRTMMVRADGRRYVARLALPPGPRMSLPKLARTLLRTWLGIVQASGARNLALTTTPEGGQFVVNAPEMAAADGGAWLLHSARIVIDARDYHLVELDTRGALFDSPYHVSFRLRHREVDAGAPDADFELAAGPGDVVLEGEATDNPFWDLGAAALRRLGDHRQGHDQD